MKCLLYPAFILTGTFRIDFFVTSFMFIPNWDLFWISVVFNVCEINDMMTFIKLKYLNTWIQIHNNDIKKTTFNLTLPLQFMPRLLPINWLQYFLSHVSRVVVCFSPIKRGPQVTCGIKPGYFARVSQHQLNSSCKTFRYLIFLSFCICTNFVIYV